MAQGESLPESFTRPVAVDMFPEVPDAHTVTIAASHPGRPIGDPSTGVYDLDTGEGGDGQIRISPSSLERYQDSVQKLVSLFPTP